MQQILVAGTHRVLRDDLFILMIYIGSLAQYHRERPGFPSSDEALEDITSKHY